MWSAFFKKECELLHKILRNNLIDVHHIGSTAIPSILAKPTLDIMCVVHTLDGIEKFRDEFERVGYTWLGENGIPQRLYFERIAKDEVTHLSHIHIFESHNPLVHDHLDFRDYLNSELKVAKEYEKLKIELKNKFNDDHISYNQGKDSFIKIVLDGLRN